MNRVALTGAGGFLGWHTRLALNESSCVVNSARVGKLFDLKAASQSIDGSDRVIHLAGVNRGSKSEVYDGNILFAEQLASAIVTTENPPPVVVYANSIQARNNSAYGTSKARGAEILAAAALKVGAEMVNIELPNLYGEHGRPFYNSVSATFCHLLANSEVPKIEEDNDLVLLHAQNAADLLIGACKQDQLERLVEYESVSGLLKRLSSISEIYENGEIPDVSTNFERDLFNTYRSYVINRLTPIRLKRNVDYRGSFFEIVRSRGGTSQASFSTTEPGVTRGDHYHRRKIERFTVLSGEATISLRRLYSDDVWTYHVNGEGPAAIDMPTGWAHNITNVGDETLYTSFWTDSLFDPANPDTITEAV